MLLKNSACVDAFPFFPSVRDLLLNPHIHILFYFLKDVTLTCFLSSPLLLLNSPLNVVDQFLSYFGRAQCLAVTLQRTERLVSQPVPVCKCYVPNQAFPR